MKKMLSSEDSSAALQTGDPLMEMMLSLFSTLMAVAVSLDNPSRVQSQANEQANTQAQQQGQTAATVRASDLVAQHFEENLANNNTQLENIRLR
jgi:ABC-type lipoprotein export system ATPase subunit